MCNAVRPERRPYALRLGIVARGDTLEHTLNVEAEVEWAVCSKLAILGLRCNFLRLV